MRVPMPQRGRFARVVTPDAAAPRSPCCRAPLDEAHHDGIRYQVCSQCFAVTHEKRERPTAAAIQEQADRWQPVKR